MTDSVVADDAIVANDDATKQLSETLATTSLAIGGGARSDPVVLPHPSSLPRTATRSLLVWSIPTEVCLQIFADRVVLWVSQLEGGRVGQWYLCECQPDLVRPKGFEVNATTLLGARDDNAEGLVYARQVCQELALLQIGGSQQQPTHQSSSSNTADHNRPLPTLLLGLSLDPSAKGRPEVFRSLVQVLVQLYQQVMGE